MADGSYERIKQVSITRKETLFRFVAENVAKDSPEIFMAGIAHETSGIREHADEAAQQTATGEGIELHFDAVLLVEKPPSASKLDFAGDGSILKIANHGGEGVVVGGVEVVEDRAREIAVALENVEIAGQRLDLREVSDAVEAGIGAQIFQRPCVVSPQRAQMELLGPPLGAVEAAEKNHQIASKAFLFLVRRRLALAGFLENVGGFGVSCEFTWAGFEAVV